MSSRVVALVLLAFSLVEVHSKMICGRSVNREGKIVGGEKARQGEYPWQVMLKRFGNHICGGSILSKNFVVTAAHCVRNEPSVFSVGYGALHKYDRRMKTASVESVHIHPGWNPSRSLANDVALLKLSEPLDLHEKTAAPICLPPQGYTPSGNLKVSGWGRTREGGSISHDLMFVKVPVIEDDQCSSRYKGVYNRTGMFCAMYPTGGKDSCQGDSGGPAVIKHGDTHYLSGVVSWGEGCARYGAPGVYTRVSKYTPWIEDTVRQYGTTEDTEQIRQTLNAETLATIQSEARRPEPSATTTTSALIFKPLTSFQTQLPLIPNFPNAISIVSAQFGDAIAQLTGDKSQSNAEKDQDQAVGKEEPENLK